MREKRSGHVDVLLVEDSEADVELVQQAFHVNGATAKLHVARTGPAALEFVRIASPRPRLIILDLNLPGMSGSQVLDQLKSSELWRDIPVVIFSSSDALTDVRESYNLQASGYIQKPFDVDEYFRVIANLERYWVDTVLLPQK